MNAIDKLRELGCDGEIVHLGDDVWAGYARRYYLWIVCPFGDTFHTICLEPPASVLLRGFIKPPRKPPGGGMVLTEEEKYLAMERRR
jgi:hypothetical protein